MSEPTITQAEAYARVEQLIRDTASALTPKPRLELIPYGTAPAMCLDQGADERMVRVNRSYWLREIPASENMDISRQVRAHWEGHGHHITASGRGDNPDLSGQSQPDGFLLALSWAEGDRIYLGATSTCVWPEGTPPDTKKTPAP
jgi:hypothetical protein